MNTIRHIIAVVAMGLSAITIAQAEPVTVFEAGEGGYHTYRIPAIVKTQDGTLLAFAEGRKDSRADSGDVDLVLKRSTDGGQSWGRLITVWDDADNTCGNPSPVVDMNTGRIVLLCTWNRGTDTESLILHNAGDDTRHVYVFYSESDGKSWSEPREITEQVKPEGWTWYATGPGHAIQLQYGEHAGRIVVPCNHNELIGTLNLSHSHVIYSDNGGKRWHVGGIADAGNESTVAELKNGYLILNMREFKFHKNSTIKNLRQVAFSADGGESFGGFYSDEGLPEPVCQASLISYPTKGRKKNYLVFANPASKEAREDFTVKFSKDGGKSWKPVYTSPWACGAYSDLVVLDDLSVGVLYEAGDDSPYERIVLDFVGPNAFK